VPERRAAGQLGILAGAFIGGAAIADVLGAASLGVALGVGQICFAAVLCWALLG
jgi:predicted MFS family arabinose efflux permease